MSTCTSFIETHAFDVGIDNPAFINISVTIDDQDGIEAATEPVMVYRSSHTVFSLEGKLQPVEN